MARMLRYTSPLLLLLIFSAQSHAQVAAQSATAASLPVDEIVRRHVAARGGMEKLKAVKALKMSGKALLQGGAIEAPALMQLKRPGQMRLELTLQGRTLVQAFDGTTFWSINPFAGSSEPQKGTADETREASDDADMDGPLVDYKEKGNAVELVGKEDFEGTDVYKLKVTAKNGDVGYQFIDATNFLSIKEVTRRKIQGTDVEIEVYPGDYKAVNGVMMPHSMEQKINGKTAVQFVMDKIEANATLDDAIFKMPAKAPAKEAAPKKP